MRTYVLLIPNPETGTLTPVLDWAGVDINVGVPEFMKQHPTSEAAHAAAEAIPLCQAWGYVVVEVIR